MEEYSSADISTRVTLAKENEKYRDELLREKVGTALRMLRRIHGEKFSYVRMTDIEKEQESLLAIMDVIQDFDPDKSLNFDGFLKWKIMGRLKAQARFQRKYDDRVTNYGVIIEQAEDESFMPGKSRLMSMEYQKYEVSGALSPEEYVCRACEKRSVAAALAGLPEREKEFISWEFGLSGNGYHSLEETAIYFNLRKSTARKIEARALSILKNELAV
jgi:RNA polymerase sigma factor (sigma-70 family)